MIEDSMLQVGESNPLDANAHAENSPAPPMDEISMAQRDELFQGLVQAHGTRLYRFIIKNIGNPGDAQDLAQQAFLEAVRSYSSFKGQSELSTWLYGIAMNLVRNHLSRAPHRRYEVADESVLDDMACPALAPDEEVEQSERMRHLQLALEDLPESMRSILLMVAVDELSYEAAAALLTVPVGTVRSRLSRARAALRVKLKARGVELDF
jgi:RNA polymerase sigma-70 factor (ECF subfamily)